MTTYANFFSPQIISILYCLHETTIQQEDTNPKSEIMEFMIKKILTITESQQCCKTNQSFEAQLLSLTNNSDFLIKYQSCISKVKNFNDFYKEVSRMLKNLRAMRNNKLQQGNLIDFLVRRMYIYFEKLDFKEIVSIYEHFVSYLEKKQVKIPQHEFMLTKSIQQLKFNLENYNPEQNFDQLERKVEELSESDHTFKTSFLKSLLSSVRHKPIESLNQVHKYFDKSLSNLFQQKSQMGGISNKINHSILSTAFLNLKMGYIEQCLQSISQGLRISQNNSDEQSINNCIIFLFKIAQDLGKYQEQILLNQHAITHSLNLTNILLMVYSCLHYSFSEKHYHCNDPTIMLMKSRNIHWTDALHFSKKKIYSNFESNCKNIYHSHRNLLIPTFLSKISVLTHLPGLEDILLNTYYQRPELLQFQLYKQVKNQNQIDQMIQQTRSLFNRNSTKIFNKNLNKLITKEKKLTSPLEIIKLKSFFNYISFETQNHILSYQKCNQLIAFCTKYGFVKAEAVDQHLMIAQILIKHELYYEALLKVEQIAEICKKFSLKEHLTIAKLLKSQVYLYLDINFDAAIRELEITESLAFFNDLQPNSKIHFFKTKRMAFKKIHEKLSSTINFYEECKNLKIQQFECLQKILNLNADLGNLVKIKSNLIKMSDIILLNPTILPKEKSMKIQSTLIYCEKVLNTFDGLQNEDYDQDLVQKKIISKLKDLLI